MSEKRSDEDRQKEVDRQLELMKAAIGDENFFSDSESDSDDSDQLKQRAGPNREAVEMARQFLLDEPDGDDEEVMLGFPFQSPKSEKNALNVATGVGAGGRLSGFLSPLWGENPYEGGADDEINLMDATQARATPNPQAERRSLSNLFLRQRKSQSAPLSFPNIWNDANARDSDEFIQENKKSRFSYLACLWGSLLWLVALGAFAAFSYYVYDWVKTLVPKRIGTIEEHSVAIQKSLVDHGVLTESTLDDPDSPQAAALQWISEDTRQTSTAEDDPYLAQRYSLAVLYYSTRGQYWTNSEGWLTNEGYCNWYGVQCLGSETSIVEQSGNGPVFDVNLSSNHLRGTIPSELNAFQDLLFLDFKGNRLEGTLPSDLGGWTGLRMFSVAHNTLYGSIPSKLVSTKDLRVLNAGHNELSGNIPPEIGDARNLREVRLEFNALHGHLPDSLRHLDHLETLHLAGNKLDGSLPDGLYDMDRLETLYLHDNSLTGHLSNDFARLSHLELLTLNHNQLVGTVPDVFTKIRHLQEAQLHANLFTGTMPPSMCDLRTLQKLSLLSVSCTKTNDANEMGVHCECCTDCH